MAAKPPIIKVPPAPGGKGAKGSAWQQFVNYWASHGYGGIRQNAAAILTAAKAEHIDPVTFGALLLNESGANFKTGNSTTGAIGIGQLEPGTFIGPNNWTHGVLPWDSSHQITAKDLQNPAVNLRLAAAYAGYLQGQYPSDWYGRYNAGPNTTDAVAAQIQAGFNGKWISKWNPKYVPNTAVTGPPTAAGPQVPGGTATQKQDLTDPWAVETKDGKIKFVAASAPPANVLIYGGTPLTESGFNQTWKQTYSDTFTAYTGRSATGKEIRQILAEGGSTYRLANELAGTVPSTLNSKNFQHSPVWKQHAPGMIEYARSILGENWKPSGGIIRQAIAGNWDQATFQAHIRQLPAYTKGPEFQTNLAQNKAAFEQIYGKADPQIAKLLHDKTLAGWTPDELQSWLRSQPAYAHTTEYQAKSTSFLSAMGLITGAQATLTGAQVDQMLHAGDSLPGTTQPTKPFQSTPTDFVSEHGKGGGYR